MVRTIRTCQDCQQRFKSQGGVLCCRGCQRKRQASARPEAATTTLLATTTQNAIVDHGINAKTSLADIDKGTPLARVLNFESAEPKASPATAQVSSLSKESALVTPATNLPSSTMTSSSAIRQLPPSSTASFSAKEQPPNATSSSSNICFICGADLSKTKHRINHIKRCQRKYGISGRDVRYKETDASEFKDPPATNATTAHSTINPYTKETTWHGDANTLLELTHSNSSTTNNMSNQTVDTTNTSKQAPLTNYFKMPARNLNNVLMANSRRLSKEHQILSAQQQQKKQAVSEGGGKSQGKKRKWWSTKDRPQYACPQYKKIPATDFVVDGFHYAKESLTQNYFLTHFHSDHYGGISSTWSAGTIYCSLPTANLVHQQLGVDKKYLHPLPMHTPTVIESRGKPITVTLMDANHCPGAVLFYFEIGKRKILHVGDFRWSRDVMLSAHNPQLQRIARGETELDELFLDTTYCDEKFSTMPTQKTAIQALTEKFEQQHKTGTKTLHLFGAYTIGKERVYLSIAQRFGFKVYVDSARYRVLSALEWPKEQMRLLTTRKEESCLWVVPMGHLTFKKLPEYFPLCNNKPFADAYENIVGYRPTGWSLSSKPSAGLVTSQTRGKISVHSVPYSEHSSYAELVDCVACLRPGKIIPTVNATKSQEQVALLMKGLRTKQTQIMLRS